MSWSMYLKLRKARAVPMCDCDDLHQLCISIAINGLSLTELGPSTVRAGCIRQAGSGGLGPCQGKVY